MTTKAQKRLFSTVAAVLDYPSDARDEIHALRSENAHLRSLLADVTGLFAQTVYLNGGDSDSHPIILAARAAAEKNLQEAEFLRLLGVQS